jgi:hypothetical protein
MSNWSRRNPFDASSANPLPTTLYGVLENGSYIPTAVTPDSDVIWADMVSEASDLSRPFDDHEITLQLGGVICLCVRSAP